MHVEIVYLPAELVSIDLSSRVAVVFDVLRATTTMTTALANGAAEIRAFGTLDEAAAAHAAYDGSKLLAGERACLRPDGFDLGNSPGDFTAERVAGRTIFMATTNGTCAVRACATARQTFVASLFNASAMADRLAAIGDDVVLVCAGVDGAPGGEDIDGAATVADLLQQRRADVALSGRLTNDVATHSWRLFTPADGLERLRVAPGGVNLARAGLQADIEFVAELDRFAIVAAAEHLAGFGKIRRPE